MARSGSLSLAKKEGIALLAVTVNSPRVEKMRVIAVRFVSARHMYAFTEYWFTGISRMIFIVFSFVRFPGGAVFHRKRSLSPHIRKSKRKDFRKIRMLVGWISMAWMVPDCPLVAPIALRRPSCPASPWLPCVALVALVALVVLRRPGCPGRPSCPASPWSPWSP